MEKQENVRDEEDIFEQGSTYKGDEEVLDGSEDTDTGKTKKDRRGNGLTTKMLIGIIAGIAGTVVLAVGILCIAKIQKEKSEPAEFLNEADTPPFEYSLTELEDLRLAGYTGDEIETYESEEVDAQTLIDEAEAARKQQYEEEIQPYFDNASKEFKRLWKDTWVGQKDLEYIADEEQYSYAVEVMNVDYKKLKPKGHQLFIKFYLENGDACFTTVTPERYSSMADEGNIVLNVEYTQTGDGKRIITNITEIEQQ